MAIASRPERHVRGIPGVDLSIRIEKVITPENIHNMRVLSFRNPDHSPIIENELYLDHPVAFHGWGVSGVASRVDSDSNYEKFWDLKKGRLPGAKIPLLEPNEYATEHIDWSSVHPKFRYLSDPKHMRWLRGSGFPFHIIFPYNESGKTLSEAVITPAFDEKVAPETPVPTICLFWIDDPALNYLMRDLKQADPGIQIGVSSLNEHGEKPPFNTEELVRYLQEKGVTKYSVIVEDPLLEPLDIASSHSQFAIPLQGEVPEWRMKRRGSLSAGAFRDYTSFEVSAKEDTPVTSRRVSPEENLDGKLILARERIRPVRRGIFRVLQDVFA